MERLTFEQHPPKISPTVLSDARRIDAIVVANEGTLSHLFRKL